MTYEIPSTHIYSLRITIHNTYTEESDVGFFWPQKNKPYFNIYPTQ